MVTAITTLAREFHKLGATIQFETRFEPRIRMTDRPFSVRVSEDLFALTQRADNVKFRVVDVDQTARHLLLVVRQRRTDGWTQHRFLCGRDQHEWFVKPLPTSCWRVDSVAQARDALAGCCKTPC